MVDLYAELRRIVSALDAASVPYAVTGGLAVSIYTTPRATEDIDLLLARPDLDRAMTAIRRLGFQPAGAPMAVAGGRVEIQRMIRIDGADLFPLDLVMPIDPALAHLLADRARVPWEGGELWIVGFRGLRALKMLRGSPQDRADLEALGPDPS
jgi:hypothetical protein